MNDIQQAREWARLAVAHETSEVSRAAAEVIQSLPDHWIDAEKVRELLHWREVIEQTPIRSTEAHLIALLHALLTPPLQTLADMTPEEREACQWMQADVKLANGGSATCVIANPRMPGAKVRVWAPHGGSDDVEEGRVTPLPDLPKLEWPGSHSDTITAESVEDVQAGRVADFEPTLPHPEDVPAGEAWRVKLFRDEVNALKTGHPHYPWSVSSKPEFDGRTAYSNAGVTLISRLVPEDKP